MSYKKVTFLLIILVSFFLQAALNDSPHFFYEKGSVIKKAVTDSILSKENISKDVFVLNILDGVNKQKFTKRIPLNHKFKQMPSTLTNIDSLFVLSDIHGQIHVFLELLKKGKVIDHNYNWNFGNGHLIIVGDVFDRGADVSEILLFLYALSIEAKNAGGGLDIINGNHERMVLSGDNRYIHPKYAKLCKMYGVTYKELYGPKTLIGKFISTWNTIITVNDVLFVHAGISPELVDKGFSKKEINLAFKENIGMSYKELKKLPKDDKLKFLFYGKGPIWYRGYFNGLLDKKPLLTEKDIDKALNHFKVNKIIVGHTTFDTIIRLFSDKIIGVDAGLKIGTQGSGVKFIGDKIKIIKL